MPTLRHAAIRCSALTALALGLGGCDKLPPDHPQPSGPREGKPVRVTREAPTDGAYAASVSVRAVAGTKKRVTERLVREAERAGCDVLVLGSDVVDQVDGDKGEKLDRHTLSGDCYKRSGGEAKAP